MHAPVDAPHLGAMNTERGREIGQRFAALNISDREWHKRTHIDPKTLQRAIEGRSTVRPSTYDAIESNLAKLEATLEGKPTPAPVENNGPGLVRFEVTGAAHFKALTVEGPVENLEELVASIDRILRGAYDRNDEDEDDDAEG